MEVDEDRIPTLEEVLVATTTDASLRLQVTDLLLRRTRNVRMGQSTPEQSDVLQRIEAALETYGSYFYPPEHRLRGGNRTARRSPAGRGTRARARRISEL